jgi:hypothetical protein
MKQMHGLPGPAFDSLIEAVVEITDYPDDPLRTFPTSDPYVRRVEFGDAGLITYLINDGARVVIILDITWAGWQFLHAPPTPEHHRHDRPAGLPDQSRRPSVETGCSALIAISARWPGIAHDPAGMLNPGAR